MRVFPTKVLTPVSVNTLVLELSFVKTLLPATPPPITPLRVCDVLELNSSSGLSRAVLPKLMAPA